MSRVVTELANQIKETGRHSTSELQPLLDEAERLAADPGQDSLTRALAHRAAGNALRLLNKFGAALNHYDHSIRMLEADREPVELARTLHARLVPLFFLGEFDDLFVTADRARDLFELQGDCRGIARLNVNLAHAYHRLERHDEALRCSEIAAGILEKVGDTEGFVAAAINSAATLTLMHNFEAAEQRYREARRAAERNNLWSSVLLCRHNLAYLRYLSGDAEEALREYAALHHEYRQLQDDWQLCRCWLDEAEIFLEIGDLEEAMRAAGEAEQLARKLDLNLEIGRSLFFEAAANLRLENSTNATVLLKEAAYRFEREGNSVWSAACKLQAAALMDDDRAAVLPEAVAARVLFSKNGLPHRLAMADLVIGRIQRSAGDSDSAVKSFRLALQEARESQSQWMQYHSTYELGVSLQEQNRDESARLLVEAEQTLDRLRNRIGSDELKMAFLADRENVYTHLVHAVAGSPESAFEFSEKARSRLLRERLVASEHSTVSSSAIQSRLSHQESILEYFIAGNDLHIFTVSRERLRHVRREGVVQRLKACVGNLERLISSCSMKWEKLRPVEAHLQMTAREHFRELYEELVAPVVDDLRETVVVVPHGFLHALPFHGLMESKHVVYCPSAVLYCAPPAEVDCAGPLFVAFATETNSSVEEVEDAAERFPGAQVLIDPTPPELRDAFSVARSLVHIAGHAGIDAIGGKVSWIHTRQGRLTSRDLLDMKVRARTLVVTGCQTARRVIRPGDEWQGLMRAFYLSGATAIVSAFWSIRDETARRFASEFYDSFNGSNVSEAVRAASAALRQWQSHPYFWAGFGVFVRRTT